MLFLMGLLLHLNFLFLSPLVRKREKKSEQLFYNVIFYPPPLAPTGGGRGSLKLFPKGVVSFSPILVTPALAPCSLTPSVPV